MIAYSATTLLAALFLVPFLWMISTSLKSQPDLVRLPPRWIPDPILWDNYAKAWRAQPFDTFLWNTVVYTCTSTLGLLLT